MDGFEMDHVVRCGVQGPITFCGAAFGITAMAKSSDAAQSDFG